MSIRAAIVAAAITVVYWYFAGNWAGEATYGWAADPTFGITDEMSPWPWRIVIVGYVLIAAPFVIAVRARHRKS